jgi:glycerol-3-phosphate acyltransferase PlsY
MKVLLVILIAYLLGSIPFSHIFPRLKGHDVRKKGTKNVGATNALVVAGPKIGALALAGDVAKGFLPVLICRYYFSSPWLGVLAGLAAIAGHDFSIFLKFKGGKGIATTGGALIAFDPIFTFIITLLWILLIVITRYFIPSTLIILGVIPIMMLVLGKGIDLFTFAALAFVLALYAHREDIMRIITGKELKTSEAIKYYAGK